MVRTAKINSKFSEFKRSVRKNTKKATKHLTLVRDNVVSAAGVVKDAAANPTVHVVTKTIVKSIAGGAVIGLASFAVFHGTIVGLAVAGAGGLGWGLHCAKKGEEELMALAMMKAINNSQGLKSMMDSLKNPVGLQVAPA